MILKAGGASLSPPCDPRPSHLDRKLHTYGLEIDKQ